MSPGKAFAVIAKRTGGPAGMAVSAVWKGRDTLAKILIVIIALLLLPVMFILMLPSLIFGNEGLDAVPDNVLMIILSSWQISLRPKPALKQFFGKNTTCFWIVSLQKPQILAPTVNTALQMTFLTRLFMKVH